MARIPEPRESRSTALLDAFFAGILSRIEPTRAQKSQAQRSHQHLRSTLKTGQFEHRILRDYLSGSYARSTALRPQDDVDIIFIIDPASWKAPFLSLSGWPDPGIVLESFQRAIRYRYPKSKVLVQRRSVCLQLSQVAIDIVPAIEDAEDSDQIYVADTKEDFLGFPDNEWILSSPLRHERIVTDLNKEHDRLFTPLVKILKHWNAQLSEAKRLKSFAVETLAATVFQHHRFEDYASALVAFFDYVAHVAGYKTRACWTGTLGVCLDTRWSLRIPDLGGSGSNLAARVKDDHCDQWVKECIRARDLLGDALSHGDHAGVVKAALNAFHY